MKDPAIEAGLVSVIIPVYNRPALLREAVESVLAQEYTQFEIIIVDDGSTDDTPAVVRELSCEPTKRIRQIRIENSGPGVAREAGRRQARGEFIQYLDSDDLLLPCKFNVQIAALRERPDCAVAYGKTELRLFGQPASQIPHKRTGDGLTTILPAMLSLRWWNTNTPLYRRAACDAVGPWLPLRMEEDWEYDCRIAAYCNDVVAVPEFVSVQRYHHSGHISANGDTDPDKLRDRCRARISILQTAIRAGWSVLDEHFDMFIRESFLVVRQADQARVAEAIDLLQALMSVARNSKMSAYKVARQLLGARTASLWSEQAYALLHRESVVQ